jgi:hypothetical protein
MLYKKINVELMFVADEADAAIAELSLGAAAAS